MFTTIKNSFISISAFGLLSLGSLFYTTATLAADIDLSTWQQAGDVIKFSSNVTLTNAYSGIGDQGDDPNGYFHINNNPNTDPLLSSAAIALNDGNSSSSLEAFLGVTAGSLPKNGSDFGIIEGSAIRGIITAGAGDIFQFTYNFRSNEPIRQNFRNDYAFVTINGNTLTPLLATVSGAKINTTKNSSHPLT